MVPSNENTRVKSGHVDMDPAICIFVDMFVHRIPVSEFIRLCILYDILIGCT